MNLIRSAFGRSAAMVILAASAAALPQTVFAQAAPLAGTWNLVPARSNFGTGPARYKSMTITLSPTGDLTLDGVDAQGNPVKGSFAAVADGKPHPVTGITAYDTVSFSKFSDTVTTYQYTKRKTTVALGNRVASPDGNIITFNEKVFDDKGKQTGTAVMVFAKPGFEMASATPPPAPSVAAAPPPPAKTTTADEDAGTAALAKDDSDGAIAAFTRALASNDKIATPFYDHLMRGIAYAKKNMNEQALADFDEAVKIKPEDPDARFRRGSTRVQLKQYPGAIEDLSAVIKADPMNAVAYRLRGFSYNTLDKVAEGAPDNEKACELNKDLCL